MCARIVSVLDSSLFLPSGRLGNRGAKNTKMTGCLVVGYIDGLRGSPETQFLTGDSFFSSSQQLQWSNLEFWFLDVDVGIGVDTDIANRPAISLFLKTRHVHVAEVDAVDAQEDRLEAGVPDGNADEHLFWCFLLLAFEFEG